MKLSLIHLISLYAKLQIVIWVTAIIGIKPTKPKVFTANPTVIDKIRKNIVHLRVNLSLITINILTEAIAIIAAPTIDSKKKEAITNVDVLSNWNLYAFLSSFTTKLTMRKIPAINEIRFPTRIFIGKLIISIGKFILVLILFND